MENIRFPKFCPECGKAFVPREDCGTPACAACGMSLVASGLQPGFQATPKLELESPWPLPEAQPGVAAAPGPPLQPTPDVNAPLRRLLADCIAAGDIAGVQSAVEALLEVVPGDAEGQGVATFLNDIHNCTFERGVLVYYGGSAAQVWIPEGIVSIGNRAFRGRATLTAVTLPRSLAAIGEEAFAFCGALTSVRGGDNVTIIGKESFSNCLSLTEATLPAGLVGLGRGAFSRCRGLLRVELPAGLAEIPPDAFFHCENLSGIHFPSTLLRIGASAFEGCAALGKACLPHGTMVVEDRAFFGCTGLTVLCVPDSVTAIGKSVFAQCPNLQDVQAPVWDKKKMKSVFR